MKPLQFNTRSTLGIVAAFAAATALGQQVEFGLRVCFFLSLCGLSLGIGLVAFNGTAAADWRPWPIALLIIGQSVFVSSLCTTLMCLGLILKSIFGPDSPY